MICQINAARKSIVGGGKVRLFFFLSSLSLPYVSGGR